MGRRFDSESVEAIDEQEVEDDIAEAFSSSFRSKNWSTTSSMSSWDPLMDISSDKGRGLLRPSSSDCEPLTRILTDDDLHCE
jgi:hypothetical protein